MNKEKRQKIVLHFKQSDFLHLSENWIYRQMTGLTSFKPIVYTNNYIHEDVFPVKDIDDFSRLQPGWFFNFLNKISIKIFRINILVLKALLKDKPDIVHAHFGIHGYDFLPYKKLSKCPLVTTFYGYDLSLLPKTEPIWKKRYKKLFKQGEAFLVEGEHMKKTLNSLGCPEEKIFVQRLGINLEEIKFQPRKLEDGQTIKMLIAGRFVEKKGISLALDAIDKFREKNKKQKIRVTIIGDGNKESEEREKIYRLIESKNLKAITKIINFLPHSQFIEKLYEHHIFLSPSIHARDGDSEGGVPVSIIAATASGMPVISSHHCDIPEVIINKKNGLLANEKDIHSLVELIKKIIDRSEHWGKMGKFGHEHIKKNYNNEIQIKRLENLYEKIISKKINHSSTNDQA